MRAAQTARHVILSGCSGGGKTTLMAELAQRGYRTVPEPGRRIVAEEMRGTGRALPWRDLGAFARRALDMAIADRAALEASDNWTFFDRGAIDAAVALSHATCQRVEDLLTGQPRFNEQVFLTPPWPEIFATDAERQHDLGEATREYHRLSEAFRRLGYTPIILPRTTVAARANFVLSHLG